MQPAALDYSGKPYRPIHRSIEPMTDARRHLILAELAARREARQAGHGRQFREISRDELMGAARAAMVLAGEVPVAESCHEAVAA